MRHALDCGLNCGLAECDCQEPRQCDTPKAGRTVNLDAALLMKSVEPKKRLVGGRYGYAIHRFPIKGGIRLMDVLLEDIQPTETPFFSLLAGRRRRSSV